MSQASPIQLNVAIGDTPPTEFRIFTASKVVTLKGTFTFDAACAAAVMAEYETHGIDLMLDYGHASVSPAIDPAQAGKAAGWFKLALRDGELWAVDVRWTEPAAAALSRKEWRFMSPAFAVDDKGRITRLANVALTNLPATRRLEPLMAASQELQTMGLNLEEMAKVAKVIGIDPSKTSVEEFMARIGAAPPVADEPAVEEPPPAEEPPAELAAPEETPAEELPVEGEDEEKAALVATSSSLVKLTDRTEPLEQLAMIQMWRASHIELESERAKVAKDRRALELSQYKANAAELVKLGAETPHTSGLKDGKVCARLLAEPLAEQTSRIAALRAVGGRAPVARQPVGSGDLVELSARELEKAKAKGLDLEALKKTKALIKRTSAVKGT